MDFQENLGVKHLEEIQQIEISSSDVLTRISKLQSLYHYFFEELTSRIDLSFKTLFSRIAFAGVHWKLPSQMLFELHQFRRISNSSKLEEGVLNNGILALRSTIDWIFENDTKQEILNRFDKNRMVKRRKMPFRSNLKGVIISLDKASTSAQFVSEKEDAGTYTLHSSNSIKIFETLLAAQKFIGLPIHINLMNVKFEAQNVVTAEVVVLEPDFLIDISTIAELHSYEAGIQASMYLLKKFIPIEKSKPLIIGNICNWMLDELVVDPSFELEDSLVEIFKKYPILFASKSDDFVKSILHDLRLHFSNLKSVVDQRFQELSIHRENLHIEPSFFDTHHGIQGRLDLFQKDEAAKKLDIIELKSGKPFKSNVYGLNANHYVQTLLYDLMIGSVYGGKIKSTNYILYSREKNNALRFAPSIKNKQIDAMHTRNRIVLTERMLANDYKQLDGVFRKMKPIHLNQIQGFVKRDVDRFAKAFHDASKTIRQYFLNQVSFLAQENYLAKLGTHGLFGDKGFAKLWLESSIEKEQNFSILKNLKLRNDLSLEAEPILIFERTALTNELANFRKGDITVLYPSGKINSPLDDQIFKCNLIHIDQDQIHVKLRNRQINPKIFENNQEWNIESDHLDSSYSNMYRSLFQFLEADPLWQSLWLGERKPTASQKITLQMDHDMSNEQTLVLENMISAKEYFLLWGPPGTGKTSIMLKNYVKYSIENTNENILLLAYTNRAVDEICGAIESIDNSYKDRYLRIGSSYACGEEYKDNLLQHKISNKDSRKELGEFLRSKRIFVSTLSSMQGRVELFETININTVVIDEASQILDPMLCGFLNRFEKFILIGDHKQLPAVVKQKPKAIDPTASNSKHWVDLRISSYQRLYENCIQNEWKANVGVLTVQGRMHKDLMAFPNQRFYSNQLKAFEGIERLHQNWSLMPWSKVLPSRLVFANTPVTQGFNVKRNKFEAEVILKVVNQLYSKIGENQNSFFEQIGIIAPFRAQVAQIKKALVKANTSYQSIMVDTVERYQGASKDIIILSFCLNDKKQLDQLVSKDLDGIDRKLNVALTRAKELIVLVGNDKLLSLNKDYVDLLSFATPINLR